MKTVAILAVALLISYFEIPKMKKQKMKKEIIIFSCILFLATALTILETNGIEVPNPLEGLRRIFGPIGLAIERFFTV